MADGKRCLDLFTGSPDALMRALDPAAPARCHTHPHAPGGKIMRRHANQIDANALSAMIVDQLGAYYRPRNN